MAWHSYPYFINGNARVISWPSGRLDASPIMYETFRVNGQCKYIYRICRCIERNFNCSVDTLIKKTHTLTHFTLNFYCVGLTCLAEEPLLNGVNPVPNNYFTASSCYSNYLPHWARLDGSSDKWYPSEAEFNAVPPTFFLQLSVI